MLTILSDLLSIFTGGLSKWAIYLFLTLGGVGLISAGVAYWNHVQNELTTLTYNNAQLQLTVDNQKTFINQLNTIQEDAANQLSKLGEENAALNAKANSIDNYLCSQKDAPASDILKNTLQDLEK